ncbi:ABC transporter substrate-binding protein [Herbiconiux sp. L3-i23]|uniref:ABC transporter substrate-binding protein n=1 Tax=Herbiconiux sp. L3-i23 TaxID=2905871 RepID=UPI002073A96E|nr:sugar ABC transporter substrate-binding protein [Herbiconiux sp. L3-i23]
MRRRNHKRLTVVIGGALVLSLTACGGSSGADTSGETSGAVEDPTSPVTITFASWVGESEEMQSIKAAFEKEHPNITVELQQVPADSMTQKLTTQIAGNNPPDAAYIDSSTVANFAARNALVNLDNYIGRSDVVDPDAYVKVFRDFATYDDSLYGLPIDGESTGLFYRTDMFEAAGIATPPTTWEEYREAAEKLTDPANKQYGTAIFAPEAAYYWYPWLWQNGGDVLNEDGTEIAFNSPEGLEAAEYYVELSEFAPPDYLNSNSYDARLGFFQGQIAMYPAGAWFAGVIAEEAPDLDGKWATAPLPEGSEGCATTVASDTLVIFEAAENKDAAWQWIEYLQQPENMALLTYEAEGTVLPTTTELLESPDLVAAKPELAGFAEAMACGESNTVVNKAWPQIEEALNIQLGAAMYGDVTVEEALENAAAEGQELLE